MFIDADSDPITISMVFIILAAVMAGSITVLTVIFSAFIVYVTPISLAITLFSMTISTQQSSYNYCLYHLLSLQVA